MLSMTKPSGVLKGEQGDHQALANRVFRVEERELSDYLYDFTNGNGDVAFPVVEAFEKQHGYVSLDVSSLFRFWAGLTPYQKSSYRLRGLSRLQALDVITRIAERRIVERREAMELEEQAERNRLERCGFPEVFIQ